MLRRLAVSIDSPGCASIGSTSMISRAARHRCRLLHRRPLEHAQPAAAIALDPDEPFALTRLQQVHQTAEPVAPLVEAAIGLTQDLFHVAQVHRPARRRRGREDLAGALDARLGLSVWRTSVAGADGTPAPAA